MNKDRVFIVKPHKRLIGITLTAVLLLLIQLIAMLFADEVNWSLTDFFVAAVLLLGTGLMCEFAIRKINKTKFRIIACAALLAVLFIIWAELAVGIFGTPFSGS